MGEAVPGIIGDEHAEVELSQGGGPDGEFAGEGRCLGRPNRWTPPPWSVAHLVLEHGHLWAHRDMTIAIADIEQASSDAV